MSSRAQWDNEVKADVLVVGIDVAKREHVAAIRLPDGRKERPFRFGNNRAGFEGLRARSEQVRHRVAARTAVFALEATGHYGHALRQYLHQQGYPILGINPAHTKRVKEIDDNSPEKSDPKDARVIADLAAQGRGRPVVPPSGVFAELRRLGKLREQYVKERTRLCNRYGCLIDLVFPELIQVVSKPTIRSIRRLLAEYPTAGKSPRWNSRRWRRG
jgi:transposase